MRERSTKSEIEQYVVQKVKDLRLENGISQAKLAHLIDISVGFVGNVENPRHIAKWNINHLNSISKALDIPFREFFPDRGI
jgi:transcriptional regulator with XRE-family HTH domain